MRIADALVKEIDLESPLTRKVLERVPSDRFGWKPHAKSMTLGWLATFSAVIYSWGVDTVERDQFDVAVLDAGERPNVTNTPELLALFDDKIARARAAIQKADDEHLSKPWTLLANGQKIFSEPRWLVLRTYVLNHAVHHRGQLTVFLRLLDIPVPALYSDSADERGGMFISS